MDHPLVVAGCSAPGVKRNAMSAASDKQKQNPDDVTFVPPVPLGEARRRAEELVAAMTPEERFALVCGDEFATTAIPERGVPSYRMADASQGIRLMDDHPLPRPLPHTTAFPCLVSLAATWDTQLVARYANAIGEECRAAGVHILLGPGMNIYRISQCGRNFEYLGEDPYLAATLVRHYVVALQATGTMATLKHFVCNNTDWHRRASNSVVHDRALREVFFPAFRAGIEAGALAVMTAYNQLDGEYCGQSHRVITELLRDELGFQGLVMTDWDSVTDGTKLANSGQDLEMPAGACLTADRRKLLGSPQIDRMASSILAATIAMGWSHTQPLTKDTHQEDQKMDTRNLQDTHQDAHQNEIWDTHKRIAYEVACDGMVLLRNNGTLPLAPSDGNVLVTGNWATRDKLCGGGSGFVQGYDCQSYLAALSRHLPANQLEYAAQPKDGQLARADTVLVFVGFEQEGEAADRSFHLPPDQEQLIRRCCDANRRTVVVLTTGGGVAMDWEPDTAAILHAFFGGQCGATAAAAILFGEVNPSGKLPFTIERDFTDSPGANYLPAQGEQVLAAAAPETLPGCSGPMAVTAQWPYSVTYDEGVFMGYRWYAANQKPVRYWFGHGLSYTSFALDELRIEQKGTSLPLTVRCRLTNQGPRAGAEVVQLYIEDSQCSVPRPPRELKGFKKVQLGAGESRHLTWTVSERDLSYYDAHEARWRCEPGQFRMYLGHCYDDTPLSESFDVGFRRN
jgi:beta-glucosidase